MRKWDTQPANEHFHCSILAMGHPTCNEHFHCSILAMGRTLHQREKRSTHVNKYVYPPQGGKGPVMSICMGKAQQVSVCVFQL